MKNDYSTDANIRGNGESYLLWIRGWSSDTKVVGSIPASSGVSVLVWGYDAQNSPQIYIFGIWLVIWQPVRSFLSPAVIGWKKTNKQTKVHTPSDWELKGQSDNVLNWFSPFHFVPSHHVKCHLKCFDFHLFSLCDFPPPHHSFPSSSLFLFLLLISFSHPAMTVRLLLSPGSYSAEWTPHHLSLCIQAVSQTHHQSTVKWLISSPQQQSSHWESRCNLAQSVLETSQSSDERDRGPAKGSILRGNDKMVQGVGQMKIRKENVDKSVSVPMHGAERWDRFWLFRRWTTMASGPMTGSIFSARLCVNQHDFQCAQLSKVWRLVLPACVVFGDFFFNLSSFFGTLLWLEILFHVFPCPSLQAN